MLCCTSPRSRPTPARSGGRASRRGRGSGWFGPWASTSTTVISVARPGLLGAPRIEIVDDLDEVAGHWAATGSGRSAPGRRWSTRTRLPARRCPGLRPREPRTAAVWLDERPDRAVRIPIRPEARSLNLANAAAIGVFEAVRQLAAPDPGPKARPPS